MQITRTEKICKGFKIKYFGEYHDFYVQSDTFNNFQNMCPDIYNLDPAHFLSAP